MIAIDIILTEENRRLIDFQMIASPHFKEDDRRRRYEYYVGGNEPVLDSRAMAMKYSRHVRRKDQPWPKGKD